jgi:C4-dicarboxylate-specific signal transduction histidine kinase
MINHSAIIGVFAGLIVYFGTDLLNKYLDDVVNAIVVHLFCGTWGVLCVPMFTTGANKGFWAQMGIQIFGLLIILTWTFVIIYFGAKIINRLSPLRVSKESEEQGLNYNEYGINDEVTSLFMQMDEQVQTNDYSIPVTEEKFTVVGQIATKYNYVIRKINEHIEQERSLKEQLIQANTLSATAEMAAGIAHEINNPLAIISSTNVSLKKILRIENVNNPIAFDFINDIDETVQRINKITIGLRNISRKSSDPNDMSHFMLRDMLSDIFVLALERYKVNSVDFRNKLSDEVLDASLFLNRVQLSQVVINLLNNAYDAVLEHSGSKKWIEVSGNVEPDKITFSVLDSGPGIDPSLVRKIFNPFFTTKEIGKGTGIGLSLSKKMMKLNGGDLFYDEVNGHTAFHIVIPRNQESDDE